MTTKYLRWFFTRLPLYFKQHDNNRDVNDEGTLERYLQVFGLELDEQVVNYADGYMAGTSLDAAIKSIIDPLECDDKYLVHIAYTLGNPPDLLQGASTYRKLLRYILAYYKVKGTKRAYEIFFALLGYNVTITEYPPGHPNYDNDPLDTYDSGLTFDAGCPTCSEYDILITLLNNDCTEPLVQFLDQTIIDLLREVIEFNEPINAILRDFVSKVSICEEYESCVGEQITVSLVDYSGFDAGETYDASEVYDEAQLVSVTVYNQDCNSGTISPSAGDFLLQESGSYLLQEDGFKITIS